MSDRDVPQVLRAIAGRPAPGGDGDAFEVCRDLIRQVIGVLSAERDHLRTIHADQASQDAVAAADTYWSILLRDLDPQDELAVARAAAEATEMLRRGR